MQFNFDKELKELNAERPLIVTREDWLKLILLGAVLALVGKFAWWVYSPIWH